MTPEPNPVPPILTYDSHKPTKDPRARQILPAYWGGLLVAGVVYGVIAAFIPHDPIFGAWADAIVVSLIYFLFALMVGTFALGLCIWVRRTSLKDVRCARARFAFLAGLIAGAYPLPVMCFFMAPLEENNSWWLLAGLAWHVIVPTTAGFFLCYRSHLRD